MISVVWLGDKEKMERRSQEIFKENTNYYYSSFTSKEPKCPRQDSNWSKQNET